MKYELHTIGGRKPPHGTELIMKVGRLPGSVSVQLRLPGERNWTDLGDLVIKNGVVELSLHLAFLCHATEDEHRVRPIARRLSADGILIWYSPRSKDLVGGANWKREIESAMAGADFVVAFLSKKSTTKVGFVQHELKYAFDLMQLRPFGARFILPVLLEDFEPPREFRDFHWIKYWESDGYERLREALRQPPLPAGS